MRKSKRILVIDDNDLNCRIVEEILGDEYQLRLARNGPSALRMVKEYRPAIILLDVMMPGMDGLETCRRIRQMQLARRPTIIMVSALSMPSEQEAGIAAGADDYIAKPFDDAEFASLIRHYFENFGQLQLS